MNSKVKAITSYFRSAVASQVNKNIEFKEDNYCYFSFEELIDGKVDESIYISLLDADIKNNEKDFINVIIVPRIIKTIFESQKKEQ